MKKISYLFLLLVLFQSCEEEFTPDLVNEPPDLVVEGYIEAGDNAAPPYILLTRSRSFFASLDSTSFADFYVHDADVTVTHNGTKYPMQELCLDDLTTEQKDLVATFLGVNPDSIKTNICVYLDLTFQLQGEAGGEYELDITSEGKTHHAVTTIPRMVPIDSFAFRKLPDERLNDYRELHTWLTDPADQKDFWRYFTKINGGSFLSNSFSIYDDAFISGKTIEFVPPIGGEGIQDDRIFTGLYGVGDTLVFKWTTIDKAHYDFRNTAEFSRMQGPFSSYIRLKGNVSDALGIWGGYNVQLTEMIVE